MLTYRPFKELGEMVAKKGWKLPQYKFDMLPVGIWPREYRGGEGGRGVDEFPIPERFHYIKGLNPDRELDGISLGRNHDYRGFVFGDIAVVENPGYGNAVYLFRVDENDSWIGEVDQTKHEVWSGSAGQNFIRKIHHTDNWQDRLLDVLTKPGTC